MDPRRTRWRRRAWLALAAMAALLSVREASAQAAIEVDLELVLAVDVSLSTTFEELATQRRGYIRAFLDDEVIAGIEAGLQGKIAVTYFEWSGVSLQRVLVPWMVIDSRASAETFADLLANAPLSREHTTSISDALLFAMRSIGSNGYAGVRKVIDISGDGPNNAGPDISTARDLVVADGITINGLPVVVRPDSWIQVFDGGIPAYYETCVIGGEGAFAITVKSMADFTSSIRQKMILEIAAAQPHIEMPVPDLVVPVQARAPIDCGIGTGQVPAP